MKKFLLAACLASVFLLSGCAALLPDPMMKAEATMVPGVAAQLHSPLADESSIGVKTVTLYFRYGKEPMLAGEERQLSVSRNESEEKALVQALLDGPSAGTPELDRLFSDQVQVLNTVSQGDVLYVTFNDALLRSFSDEPSDWQTRDDWKLEVPLRRRLAMAGLTASVAESFGYHKVQVLVQQRSDASTSLRLDNSYFKDSGLPSGPAAPFLRDESLLLTQQNTARTVLTAWQQKDWERLYLYLAASDPAGGQARPSMDTAVEKWNDAVSVVDFSVTGGSVLKDGSKAVIGIDVTLARGDAPLATFAAYPVALYRDRGIWKITYDQLSALMELKEEAGQ